MTPSRQRRPRRARLVHLASACALIGHSLVDATPAAAERLDWRLQLESGAQYDSNSHRRYEAEPDAGAIDPSPLLRAGARLQLNYRAAENHRVDVWAMALGTAYSAADARTENALISTADARYQWFLPARQLTLSARASHYDALAYSYDYAPIFDCSAAIDIPRFFASHTGEVALGIRGPDEHRLRISAGLQRFRYKACSQFHWVGERYGMHYQTTLWRGDPDEDLDAASIDIRADYQISRRGFEGELLVDVCPPDSMLAPSCLGTVGLRRADLAHTLSAELVYTGARIYSIRYELGAIDSNSFGRSLARQRLELGLTTELWRQIFLTAKAAIQLDIYPDSLLLDPNQMGVEDPTIDEQNHNSLSLHLARDLSKNWAVEGRYALYSNEFASGGLRYRRQVVYLGAVYRYAP